MASFVLKSYASSTREKFMIHEKALQFAEATENKLGPSTGGAAWRGRWKNQIGSTMHLEIAGNVLSGTYTSATSGQQGGGAISGTLQGLIAGDLIAFTVLWPGGSMTSWTGQLVDDEQDAKIKTLWHLITNVPDVDEPTRLWTSTFTGADDFRR
jgi:hypothetical protein